MGFTVSVPKSRALPQGAISVAAEKLRMNGEGEEKHPSAAEADSYFAALSGTSKEAAEKLKMDGEIAVWAHSRG